MEKIRCINANSPKVIALSKKLGYSPKRTASEIENWQIKNDKGTAVIPTMEDMGMKPLSWKQNLELYKSFKLLTNQGERKIFNRETAVKFANSLNEKGYDYNAEPVRLNADGSKWSISLAKKLWTNRNDDSNQMSLFQQEPSVNYGLKSIDILNSDKAKQIFEKGKKANWDLNKILTELAIPKEQKQLILDSGKTNREEIITDLLANYSFTIEINLAKSKGFTTSNDSGNTFTETEKEVLDKIYRQIDNEGLLEPGSDEYYNEVSKRLKANERPTTYYSNLTVPGGVNYTENEIATPAITPNIKGHAQFATDKGIGWFRSDDKQLSEPISKDSFSVFSYDYIEKNRNKNGYAPSYEEIIKAYNKSKGISDTKTRRILEVQSDLFQKGRDKNDLVKKITGQEDVYESNDEFFVNGLNYYSDSLDGETITYFKGKDTKITFEEYNKAYNQSKQEIKGDTLQNKFLQLLNKDNNWVTFFIKSIIQDSAKKGYEKVLFPTASTINNIEKFNEIYSRLESFKKAEDNIIAAKSLKDLDQALIYDSFLGLRDDSVIDSIFYFNEGDFGGLQIALIKEIKENKKHFEAANKTTVGTLNFYENTLTNILNKNYKVNKITDEYGNTWNEIEITPELSN